MGNLTGPRAEITPAAASRHEALAGKSRLSACSNEKGMLTAAVLKNRPLPRLNGAQFGVAEICAYVAALISQALMDKIGIQTAFRS